MVNAHLVAVLLLCSAALHAGEPPPPPALTEDSEVTVRLSFAEPTPSTEIYRHIAKTAGIDVVFAPRFNERLVTLNIETTTSAALDLVAAAAGDLWVPTVGNAIIVADDTPQNHREYRPLVVQTFVLENGCVREADSMLRSIGGVSRLATNESLRTVTVREPADMLPIIERLIARIDHAPGEVEVRVQLLRLAPESEGSPLPTRLDEDEYVDWRRRDGATVLADSTLGLLGDRHANLHLGAIDGSIVGLDLRLDGRVHPHSEDVSLGIRLLLSSTGSEKPDGSGGRSERGRIETSARLASGSTLLLRVPGSIAGGVAIAIAPTIVRGADFDPSELTAVWVGTESRMQASR